MCPRHEVCLADSSRFVYKHRKDRYECSRLVQGAHAIGALTTKLAMPELIMLYILPLVRHEESAKFVDLGDLHVLSR